MPLVDVKMQRVYSAQPAQKKFAEDRVWRHYELRGLNQRWDRDVVAVVRYVNDSLSFSFLYSGPNYIIGTVDGTARVDC